MSKTETTGMPEYYTVVYRVMGDKRKQDEWWQALRPLFLSDDPISIITIATGDLLARLDALETANEEPVNIG